MSDDAVIFDVYAVACERKRTVFEEFGETALTK